VFSWALATTCVAFISKGVEVLSMALTVELVNGVEFSVIRAVVVPEWFSA
jgi:hypothetical protein